LANSGTRANMCEVPDFCPFANNHGIFNDGSGMNIIIQACRPIATDQWANGISVFLKALLRRLQHLQDPESFLAIRSGCPPLLQTSEKMKAFFAKRSRLGSRNWLAAALANGGNPPVSPSKKFAMQGQLLIPRQCIVENRHSSGSHNREFLLFERV